MIEIHLLGGYSLVYDGHAVQGLGAPRMQSLVAYLVLHRGIPQLRQHLAFLFWPDSTESQARTNLRKLLHELNKALPEASHYLQLAGHTVQWAETTPLILDVAEFENAILAAEQSLTNEQECLSKAVQLYKGDLLPGCYEEWIEPERERLRRQLANALERLSIVLEGKRDYRTAMIYNERLLQLDNANESVHRRLMQLHSLLGDRAGALRAYQDCVTILKNELSVDPDRETRELYERLLNSDVNELSFPEEKPGLRIRPLVGREREWAAMQEAWNRVTAGKPRSLIIFGEAGIGKTRLAEEMLQWASQLGYLSAMARCFPVEGRLAYAPILDWLRSSVFHKRWINLEPVWLTELMRLMPDINLERPDIPLPKSLNAEWQRQRLFESLIHAISSLTLDNSSVPLVLLIDDLQWCDSETIAWLHYLMRCALPAKLLLVGTLRPEELIPGHPLESLLADLRAGSRLDEIALGPLNAAETKKLAEDEAGHPLELNIATRLYEETEGYPLFVVESIRMADDPNPALKYWIPAWEENRQSSTVQAVIARRLALLSPAGRDLAGIAATIGHSFTYPILVRACREFNEATLVRGLDELLQRHIVREHEPNSYDFSHDKIRVAAYQGLSNARRRFLHRCVAESLESLVRDDQLNGTGYEREELSGQIGSQFEKAGLAERAVPYYQQAANVARRVFANERALRYCLSALALLHNPERKMTDPLLAAQIEEQAGDILLLMTHRAEARAAYERGLELLLPSDRVGQAKLGGKIGNTWRDEYHFKESLEFYARALAMLGDPVDLEADSERVWWQCWIQIQIEVQNVYYWLAWTEKSEALFQKLNQVVDRYATPLQRSVFFSLMGATRLRANRYIATEEIVTIIKIALEAVIKAGLTERIPAAQFVYGFALLLYDDIAHAEEEINTALKLAEQRGDLSLETRCLTYLTIARRKRGDLDGGLSLAQRALRVAETAKMPEYIGAASANLAWIALRKGESARAREHCLVALAMWSQSPEIQAAATPYFWTAIWPLVRVHLDEGDTAGAIVFARQLLEPHRKGLPPNLTAALTRAIEAWDGDSPEEARQSLLSTMTLAEMLGEF